MKSLSKHLPALTGDLFVERGMVVRSRGEHRQRDVCSLVQILDILSLQIRKLEKHVYQKYGLSLEIWALSKDERSIIVNLKDQIHVVQGATDPSVALFSKST